MSGTPPERAARLIGRILEWPPVVTLLLQTDGAMLARLSGAEHELDLYVPRERRTFGGYVVRRGWS